MAARHDNLEIQQVGRHIQQALASGEEQPEQPPRCLVRMFH